MSLIKTSFFSWSTDMLSTSLISLTFCLSIMLLSSTDNFDYLHKSYKQNWESKYIIDLKTYNNQTTCPADYELLTLGLWTGFKSGCHCENSYTGEVIAFDDSCDNFKGDMKSYTCTILTEIPPVNITSYKENIICVKRGEFNFLSLQNSLYSTSENETSGNSRINLLTPDILSDDKLYYDFVKSNFLNSSIFNYLNPNAIIDIKIINKYDKANVENKIDLHSYEETKLTDKSILLIKRLGKKDKDENYLIDKTSIPNLFYLNNLIVDIHLFNYLWCGYLDISSSSAYDSANPIILPQKVDFGYDYCNNFYHIKSQNLSSPKIMFYNDEFKRTERINLVQDFSDPKINFTKKDFYPSSIYDYYKNKKIKVSEQIIPNKLEPILLYEKYYSGLGCKTLSDLNLFLDNIKSNSTMRTFTIFSFILQFVFIGILIFYGLFKKNERTNLATLMILLLIAAVGLNIFFCFSAMVISASSIKYIDDFQKNCQNNFYNQHKTNMMELEYNYKLVNSFKINFMMFLTQIILCMILIMSLFGNCFCKGKNESEDNRQVFELKRTMNDISLESNPNQGI